MSVAYMFKGRVAITTLPLNICRLFYSAVFSPQSSFDNNNFSQPTQHERCPCYA